MNTYYLVLDLVEQMESIASYEKWHQNVWPEIKESIFNAGIIGMEIYRTGNRLLMVMEVGEDFSFDQKSRMDASNPKVQEWETLMDKYQKRLPWAKEGQKWVLMDRIFHLSSHDESNSDM
ncbi:L-rhamnose mutarotase [Belliella sp. DSM 107340]|uniref:L-rhamnose mutarotase n=1 Tax=Belliella calami TaxID=2923436 RepID=A0ABS9UUF8_9BACT|nr:L-rhamnose mutarotase [Belliella calami]MCH7400059.1 L-rhamnose mutarotase [Belliella calami]